MQRINPFLSIPGIFLAVIFILALGINLIMNGSTMFSPGALTSRASSAISLQGFTSHASLERQCERCHQPLVSDQGELCLSCHQEIVSQLIDDGLHSRMTNIMLCYQCHPDHRGKEFSPIESALLSFDHSVTHFSLVHHALDYSIAPMRCEACHAAGMRDPQVMVASCLDCHSNADNHFMSQHVTDFGQSCLDCHDGADRMTAFDHATTRFPLEGKHVEVSCAGCHPNGKFVGTPATCQDCHVEPDLHRSVFSSTCQDCHTAQDWRPVTWAGETFEHQKTGFSLQLHLVTLNGEPITCTSCHPTTATGMKAAELPAFSLATCQDCHQHIDAGFYVDHATRYGDGCLSCHDGVDRMSNFDHQQVFAIDGKHAEIECLDCHGSKNAGFVFKGLPKECVNCHQEPELHAGFFGLVCQDCHSTTAWRPAYLQKHDFPLDHGNANSDCQSCHPANYVEYNCYTCHEHQPDKVAVEHREEGIVEPELSACVECHPQGIKEKNED